MTAPDLSIVILSWDNQPLTERCVASLRSHTDVPHEIIIVDNGSEAATAAWVESTANVAICNSENRGFAAAMNQGLDVAQGRFVAFVNNDTEFPAGWARPVLAPLEDASVGISLPAVTAAGNPVTVRQQPGVAVVELEPFGHLPSGVVYVMRTDLARRLGGWNESYGTASAEDLDLAFTVWANDLAVVLVESVLVEHVGRATVKAKLPDRFALYRANLEQFLERWSGDEAIVRLDECPAEIHRRNRAAGRAAALWLKRLIEARDESRHLRKRLAEAQPSPTPRRWWRR